MGNHAFSINESEWQNMEPTLRLYTISDEYINYLHSFDKRVSSNKEENRNFERKYLGTVININKIDYFVPLASPKDSDYFIDKDGIKKIRKSIVPIIRIVHIERNGAINLLGTIKFNNMIPAIESEIIKYDIKHEPDLEYKDLVYKEWNFIHSNKNKIYKNANVMYKQKTENVQGAGYLNNTVDFNLLEQKAKEYIGLKKE